MSQSTKNTIAKNASVLMFSQVLTWSLTLLQTVFLARYLGAEGIGKYQYATSLWAIVSIFAGFGIDIMLTKEIARDHQRTEILFGTSMILRTILFTFVAGGMAVYVYAVDMPTTTKYVVAILGVSQLIALYSTAAEAAIFGLERMEYISIGSILLKVLQTVGFLLLMILGYGVIAIATVTVFTAFVHLVLMLYFLVRLHPIPFIYERSTAIWILKTSYLYLSINVFLVLYSRIDIIILARLTNETTIGWYATANQLFGTLLFIPTVFIATVFPTLSRLHGESAQAAGTLMSKSFDMLLLVGVPIGLGLVVVAEPLVLLLFGPDFAASAPVLAIFGIVLIFTYQNVLVGMYFISSDKPRYWTWVMASATVLTIPLDLMLVPWCVRAFGNGAMGGALAFLITEVAILSAGLWRLPRGTFHWAKLWLVVRIVAAGLLMASAAWIVRDYFIALPIAVGAAVYFVLILLFRVVPAEDWAMFRQLSQSVLVRLRRRNPQPANL